MYKVNLMGFVGNDAVTRNLQSGDSVTEFSIAWNPNPKDKEAKAVWVKCQIWGEYGQKSCQHITKGSSLFVYADQVPPKIYTDKNGVAQIDLSVRVISWQFTPSRKDAEQPSFKSGYFPAQTNTPAAPYNQPDNEDDLPF